jgi:hypothetical protein
MKFLSALLLFWTAVVSGYTAPELPDTPAARQFANWLEAFNGGDRNALRLYFERNNPDRVAQLEQELRLRDKTGGFDLVKIEDSKRLELTGILMERKGIDYVHFTFEVEEPEPHKIHTFRIRVVPRPADMPSPPHVTDAGYIAGPDGAAISLTEEPYGVPHHSNEFSYRACASLPAIRCL